MCVHLRNPLTINKDNFIEDLRFRVLSESTSSTSSVTSLNDDSLDAVVLPTVREEEESGNGNGNGNGGGGGGGGGGGELFLLRRNAPATADTLMSLTSWNLEIRKFSKADEACYQCQLNSYQPKTIHYCLKLQSNNHSSYFKIHILTNTAGFKLNFHKKGLSVYYVY